MPNDTETTILLQLGEMNGLLKAMLERLNSTEDNHQRDMESANERMNGHSKRIAKLENAKSAEAGERVGKRAMITLGLVLIPLALGLMGWWWANGYVLLQAGAKTVGG